MNTKIIHIKYKLRQWYLVKRGYLAEDYEPIKCTKCKSTDLEEYDEDLLNGNLTLSFSVRCKHCKTPLNDWAYGSWYRA